jgi:SAM-dependent methyltransferase
VGNLVRSCPVCELTKAEPLYENIMAPVGGLDMSYRVGGCMQCGFIFADRIPDADYYNRYYQLLSKYDVSDKISELDMLRIDAAVSMCLENVSKDSTIVDIGCGYGALLSGFKASGWGKLYGVDPAPKSRERARDLFGLSDVYTGTLSDAHVHVPVNEADLVCITAVLEHLPNLREDIGSFLCKLKPGCRILVEVPALETFPDLNAEPFGEFSLEHIQFFSALTLENFFSALGAKLVHSEIILFPSAVCGSTFGLFEWIGNISGEIEPRIVNNDDIKKYIQNSRQRMAASLLRIPNGEIVIYGAGSHTARLLPALDELGDSTNVVAVVDGNQNLLNKTIGRHIIQPPSAITTMPNIPILVSSFRFQNEIAATLRDCFSNPLVLLYV